MPQSGPYQQNVVILDVEEERIHLGIKEEVIAIEFAEKGRPGGKGDKGDQGDAGSGDANFLHNQIEPSATWTIVHNLGKYPSVGVTDSAGSVVVGDVFYQSTTTVIVDFDAPFGGKAHLN